MASSSRHVVVVGSGIIGASCAAELTGRGFRVTLVDQALPGGTQAASYGNGAFLSPASIIPMSFPGMWRKIPGYLLDPLGPVAIRWRYLPRLLPWLWRYLLAGVTETRFRRTAGLLNALLRDGPDRHTRLAALTGQEDLIHRKGLVYAFADRAAYETEGLSWRVRRDNGIETRELDRDALHALIPDLAPSYGFGILVVQGAHCTDPGGYVAGIVSWCEGQGVRLTQGRVTGFLSEAGRLRAVCTDRETLPCDAVVIAAGARSAALAKLAGDRVPLESERGYHVEIPNAGLGPEIPVMPQDGKMANTMTRGGLRASGQVELSATDAAPDWRRADVLLGHLMRTYPALAARRDDLVVNRWQGNRPSTPDGLPVIGRASGLKGVFHAFGHGHVGLASGPKTAEIVADLIEDKAVPAEIAAFSARRFR